MSSRDRIIWDKLRVRMPHDVSLVVYNARLGPDAWVYPIGDSVEQFWRRSNVKRLDAVLIHGEGAGYTIVECRPRAGSSALGSAICYRWLWEKFSGGLPLRGVVVATDKADEYYTELFLAHAVEVWEIGQEVPDPEKGTVLR